MSDWRVVVLSALGVLILVGALLVLALPDTYEGGEVYSIDPTHALRILDVVGLALMALGGLVIWGAGVLWQRQMTR
jgi:hypothetical protein